MNGLQANKKTVWAPEKWNINLKRFHIVSKVD